LDAGYNNLQKDESLKSPPLYTSYIDLPQRQQQQQQQQPPAPAKAFRRQLKQQLDRSIQSQGSESNDKGMVMTLTMTPQQMAKTFTRLIARSRAFFHLVHYFHDVYNWKSSSKSLTYLGLWTLLCK
jgi:hypothetical protein